MTAVEFATVVAGFGIAQIAIALYRSTRDFILLRKSREQVMRGLMWVENSPDCAVFARDRRVLTGVDPSTLAPDPESIESCAHVHFHPATEGQAARWLVEVWFTASNGAEVTLSAVAISKEHAKRIGEALTHPIYRTTLAIGSAVESVPRARS